MIEKTAKVGGTSWRLPTYFGIIEIVLFIPIAISHPDTVFFVGLFLVIPAVFVSSIILIAVFASSVIGRGRLHPLSILTTLAILWFIPTSLVLFEREYPFALHETARWLAGSKKYKDKVLAQRTSNGELRYIEWDGAGFAGVANRTVCLVFDPSDAVLNAVKSRRRDTLNGITCEVRFVQRLESHWYSVVFDIDQDLCN
jgi:hypothetical protein